MTASPGPPLPLSPAERETLAAIAASERAADADFADLLAVPRPGPDGASRPVADAPDWPRTRTLVAAAILTVICGIVLLPGTWVLAIVVVAVLVVIPTALVTWALRQGPIDPDRCP